MSPVVKRKGEKFTLPSKYLLFILTIVCTALIILTFYTGFLSTPLSAVGGFLIVPMQDGISKAGSWLSTRSEELVEIRSLIQENEELKQKVDELTMENISLQQLTSPRYVAEIPAPLVPPPSPEPAFITEPAFVSVPAATVKSETPAVPPSDLPKSFAPKQHKRGSLTKDDILLALEQCHGNRSAAAQILGITRKTLYRNMERLGMDSGEFPT